jgi:hypothetical protein
MISIDEKAVPVVLPVDLRDYFAAHAPALPSPVRDAFVKALKRGDEIDLGEHADVCARWAILYADAMIKARAE